jgi:predicted Rossmann fold flavoprotein
MRFDVIVIGAGAAGMMCAAVAGQRGLSVALIDHAEKLGEKIRISGGGRCNFTNLHTSPAQFLSDNPHFCRSALARYTPADFIALVRKHGIGFHEKHKGQLFCDDSAEQIIAMLQSECQTGQVRWFMPCKVHGVQGQGRGFAIQTSAGVLQASNLVIATGGLSIPKIGASDFGLRLARQFGITIVEPRPALVPLTFDAGQWRAFAALAGLALPVSVSSGTGQFDEDLLFTHRGLSGPAILQISSYWRSGQALAIDLLPSIDLAAHLRGLKVGNRQQLNTVLEACLPKRLADTWLEQTNEWMQATRRKMADLPDRLIAELAASLQAWSITPSGTEGYRKAEVMAGGVDTRELSQQSMAARRVPGLHFIGEVVDVTGWLGGYNFQWAWASAQACGRGVAADRLR